jgi:glutamate dehydrogenase (NADP+)
MKEKIEKFVRSVKKRNPNEPEFIQAVEEVAEAVIPFENENPEYKGHKLLTRMTEPERVIMFRVTWLDDNNKVRVNKGYRVQMNSAIGPYKGGLRFHPTVNLSVLKFLAFEQVFKNSLTTLPLGGGKGGSDFDPKGKSDFEVMRFCQSFMTELYKHIGKDTDVPAGDIGVGSREIGYLFGQYKRLQNEFNGILTGKGLSFGGSLIRPEATGYGAVYFAESMLKTKDDSLNGKTALISGSGNVAQYAAEKAIELGVKVLTMSDSQGCMYDPDGIDMEKLSFIKDLKNNKRGRIREYLDKYPHAKFHEGIVPWMIEADLAFPCATQNELCKEHAEKLVENGIQLVAEGANMPCTSDAVQVFKDAKILFAPGKAANAGGVATSGLEMTQNAMRFGWTSKEVDKKLKDIMESIHEACVKYGKQEDGYIDYVKGSNIAGFVKVADAMMAQGVV